MAQIHKDIQKMPEEKRPSDFEIQVMGVIWFHKKYQYGALLYKMLKRLDLVYMLKPLLRWEWHLRASKSLGQYIFHRHTSVM